MTSFFNAFYKKSHISKKTKDGHVWPETLLLSFFHTFDISLLVARTLIEGSEVRTTTDQLLRGMDMVADILLATNG